MSDKVLRARVSTGGGFVIDPKRPKAAIAEYLGYAPSSGRRMFVDTKTGPKHVGYVFGQYWVRLEWVTYEPWMA